MGYLHIDNLYRDSRIFEFGECYALEKIHGTSAHIDYDPATKELTFFSGGEPYKRFVGLFDQAVLKERFESALVSVKDKPKKVTVFGEAYGGKQQGMRETYGDQLKFVVFDMRADERWADVLTAHAMAQHLGLEFVDYVHIPTKLHLIDAERDKPSTQAVRNGIKEPKKREGVVLRPIDEANDRRGNRIITKHKNNEFMETKTPRQVDPDKIKVLAEANAIADEWVTDMRLQHVIDRAKILKGMAVDDPLIQFAELGIEDTGCVIKLMLEDVTREAKGEIVESKESIRAIGSATARLFKKWLSAQTTVAVSGENK